MAKNVGNVSVLYFTLTVSVLMAKRTHLRSVLYYHLLNAELWECDDLIKKRQTDQET